MRMNVLLECLATLLLLHAFILLLHIAIPAKQVEGYVCDVVSTRRRLKYRLNGLRCLLVSVIPFILGLLLLSPAGQQQHEIYLLCFLSYNYATLALLSNILGLALTVYMVYIRFPRLSAVEKKGNAVRRAPTATVATNGNSNASVDTALDQRGMAFFNGLEFNPRVVIFGRVVVDIKMYLYLVGAILLELNVLSSVLRERLESNRNENSRGMIVYAALLTWFCAEYMYFERVHLFTYDLFAEKVGFKLAWGCLCFYPFFYPIGMFPILYRDHDTASDITMWQACCIVVLFFTGCILTRGANLQKYYFRRFPERTTVFFGLVHQRTLQSSDRILCSGFWGLARHVNYFGEILQALALALPGFWLNSDDSSTTMCVLPWLYPLYCVLLFIPRQRDDDALMQQKYGPQVMDEYRSKVPYRIVPGLF